MATDTPNLSELYKRLNLGSAATATTTTGGWWPSTSSTFTLEEEEKTENPDYTKYIRENHPDDQVLQAFADLIDEHPAIWEAMTLIYKDGQATGDGLVDWNVKRKHAADDAVRVIVKLEIIDREATTRARAK